MTSQKYTPRDTNPQHNLSSAPPLGQSPEQSGIWRETAANGLSCIFPHVYPAEQPKQTTYRPPGAIPSHVHAFVTTAVSPLSEIAFSLWSNWYTGSPFVTHLKQHHHLPFPPLFKNKVQAMFSEPRRPDSFSAS